MVLVFLRDFRSALIVVVTIPFSILSAVVCLWMAGQTINIMTLGGLALAVGVLVDEATVLIESIHTHLTAGASPARAALEASQQTSRRGCSRCCACCRCSSPPSSWWASGASFRATVTCRRIRDGLLVRALEHHRADSLYLDVEARAASGPGILRTPPVRLSRAAQERSDARWFVVGAYLLVTSLIIVCTAPSPRHGDFPAIESRQLSSGCGRQRGRAWSEPS